MTNKEMHSNFLLDKNIFDVSGAVPGIRENLDKHYNN
jgi:hypothetical protein